MGHKVTFGGQEAWVTTFDWWAASMGHNLLVRGQWALGIGRAVGQQAYCTTLWLW